MKDKFDDMIRRDSKKHEMESNTQEKSKNIASQPENIEPMSKDSQVSERVDEMAEDESTEKVDIPVTPTSAGNAKDRRKSLISILNLKTKGNYSVHRSAPAGALF